MERNEAIESLRKLYSETNAENKAALDCLIPELAESEDERIRKFIVETVFYYYGDSQEYLDVLAYLEKQKEQKPAEWSDEDEKKREFLIKGIEDRMGFGWASDPFSREDLISWLESIRPQPKQEWSEEDKRMINNIVDDLCYLISWIKTFAGTIDIDATIEDIRGHIKWLRSLRSRPKSSDNWKPSEGQIQALERAIISLNSVDDIPILTELRDKLKILM